jgi:hypothetical protein
MPDLNLQTFDYWDREFESRRGHGYSSLVFVVYCVGSGICDELVTSSEEFYRVCVRVRVRVRVCACARVCNRVSSRNFNNERA